MEDFEKTIGFLGLTYRGDDISFLEILALEQKRLSGGLGERVGEAIAVIQSRRVAALAEVVEGMTRCMGLVDGHLRSRWRRGETTRRIAAGRQRRIALR